MKMRLTGLLRALLNGGIPNLLLRLFEKQQFNNSTIQQFNKNPIKTKKYGGRFIYRVG